MNEKTKNLILKVNELSKRGIPGEKEAAKATLDSLLKKHNITLDELEGLEKNYVEFSYTTMYEEKLLSQIVGMVLKSGNIHSYNHSDRKRKVFYKLCKSDEISVKLHYSVYRIELKKELKITCSAFFQANSIFPGIEDEDISDMSNDERMEVKKMLYRAGGIGKTQVKNQIEAGKDHERK